jgi:3-hydroxybutyryl-CoA dehydrogenase
MGAGIAEVLARGGLTVIAAEADEAALARGRGHLEHSTERAVGRGKLDAQAREQLLGNITFTTDFAQFAQAQLVVEAVPENLELKARIFNQLDEIVGPDTILASNTSSLSVTEISVHTKRPGKVVGLHFFNPAPVLKLVEVVRTVMSEADVVEDVVALAEKLGKSPVVIGDRAGFIANALLFGYLNHAVNMYESKYASREDLDAAMRFGCGYPMGPLALLDLIGLDTAYEILATMYAQSRDRLHAPSPILKQMVTAGLRGRKSGKGFYTYQEPDSPVVVVDDQTPTAAAFEGVVLRPIERAAVIGTGTMATGIVEVFAKNGYEVLLRARTMDKAAAAVAKVGKSLARAVSKGKMTQEAADATLARILPVVEFAELSDVDLVVEAVAEDLEVKRAIFRELDAATKPGAVLATTTSSLPVIETAVATSRPRDVIGLHFFNPAPIMKLVEIVHTVSTDPDVIATSHALVEKLGKHPVHCADRSGFIVNALLFPYLNDAIRMLEAHYATADDIDKAMKVGCGLPMGPFELLDVVGLDVSLAIERELYYEFRESGYAPASLLEQLVTAGRLGRKVGKGFRAY